jgi:hypothetical protein
MHRLRYLIGTLTLALAAVFAVWIVRVLHNADDRPGLPLQVEFREARGLRPGANVRYRGVNVGTVRNVSIALDGSKALAQLLLDPAAAVHACVNSEFWIVTPRFSGLTDGASGLDTLVRDSYVAFCTPAGRGLRLPPGSLIDGRERPPESDESEALDDVEHGDLLMTLLVPENHGLRPGSTVIFRGVATGDVRSVTLAPAGTHVEVGLRIHRKYRQTVTDKTVFWVARPYVSGALFSGFTLTDVNSLLTPYVSYYGEPGKGVLVQDGYRAAADVNRPNVTISPVPGEALRQEPSNTPAPTDGLVLVRIMYEAIERDTWSADDPVQRQGTGVLVLDRAGRAVVVTARSLVDGFYTERDLFGTKPDIDAEQIRVFFANGTVLRAGRVWIDPAGNDLAALVLEHAPPDTAGTPAARLSFAGGFEGGPLTLHPVGADGVAMPTCELGASVPTDAHGAPVTVGERMIGVLGRKTATSPELGTIVALGLLPQELRPQ